MPFPVIAWNTFIDHVRANINPLSADDHMKEVIQQLQLMGEVIYVKGNVCVDVIILDPKWLCYTVLVSFSVAKLTLFQGTLKSVEIMKHFFRKVF